jgi:hypothetical protein
MWTYQIDPYNGISIYVNEQLYSRCIGLSSDAFQSAKRSIDFLLDIGRCALDELTDPDEYKAFATNIVMAITALSQRF